MFHVCACVFSCLFHDVSCLGSWACTLSNVSYCFMFGRNTIVGVGKREPDLFVAMVSEYTLDISHCHSNRTGYISVIFYFQATACNTSFF